MKINEGEIEQPNDRAQMKSEDSPDENVKSCAVVKFAAVDAPAKYAELHSNTDLNLPPANWLRESQGYQALKSSSTLGLDEPTVLSSFQMACNFPDYIGEVDVVSDSENIKKLLKIPFSKSQISMVVHRIGKTILLDDFDIHRYLLRTAEKEWDWLRKFYLEHVLQSLHLKDKAFPRKNKSRYYLQNKSMFSKFLYHSVVDGVEHNQLNCGNVQEENSSERPQSSFFVDSSPPHLPDPVSEESEYDKYSGEHKFLRDVLWTFEDITMLIGSNMPIFGGGTHPCVSLRLREKNNPINILTGLDYWLDNLMCNVPEVVMCYHLNGIVQKYEFLKTDDLPHLENCQFSPKLVKDIAQNILSFLKTKATKAGHTYWLFKGKDDDVVKLYDLSSLCEGYLTETNEQNPFAMHVAFLLHTVARNLYLQQCNENQRKTMHILLKHSISLLDAMKHPQVATSSHFLLADLYLLPDDNSEDASELKNNEETVSDDEYFPSETSFPVDSQSHSFESIKSSFPQDSSSVEVEALCLAHKPLLEHDTQSWLDHKMKFDYIERCDLALQHIAKGLSYVDKSFEELNRSDRSRRSTVEEVQKMAKPFLAIPLHYFPLQKSDLAVLNNGKANVNIESHKSPARYSKYECGKHNYACWMSYTHKSSCPLSHIPWQIPHKINLLKKGAVALSLISENVLVVQKALGSALRYLQMAVLCLEASQTLSLMYEQNVEDTNQILQKCLFLAGDIHHKFGLLHEISSSHVQQFEVLPDLWETMTNSVKQVQDCSSYDFIWKVSNSNKQHFRISIMCYKEILSMHEAEDEYWKCKQRIGSTYNELAVKLMIEAETTFLEPQSLTETIQQIWKESYGCFLEGIQVMQDIKDIPNLALVTSNLGRLMRLYAHFLRGNNYKEFGLDERRYYQKAMKHYEEALTILGNRNKYSNIWDTVMWEFSTTLFCMANLLQDFAPLSTRAQEDVECEILSLFTRALHYCDTETISPRQLLCQYRAATIHQRVASLYHNAIRNEIVDDSGKHKEHRLKAEEHYQNASVLFQTMERLPEYLRVQLEIVGLHEFVLQKKSGYNSRLRSLCFMLEMLLQTKNTMVTLLPKEQTDKNLSASCENENIQANDKVAHSDDEQKEVKKLLLILSRQLESVLSKLLKLHSGKKGQHRKTEIYKTIYNIATSMNLDAESPSSHMIPLLCSTMDRIQCIINKEGICTK